MKEEIHSTIMHPTAICRELWSSRLVSSSFFKHHTKQSQQVDWSQLMAKRPNALFGEGHAGPKARWKLLVMVVVVFWALSWPMRNVVVVVVAAAAAFAFGKCSLQQQRWRQPCEVASLGGWRTEQTKAHHGVWMHHGVWKHLDDRSEMLLFIKSCFQVI
jgi:hypothetical protein